jgi:hypothetical protein
MNRLAPSSDRRRVRDSEKGNVTSRDPRGLLRRSRRRDTKDPVSLAETEVFPVAGVGGREQEDVRVSSLEVCELGTPGVR